MTIFTEGLRQSTGVNVHEVGASLGESLAASAGEAVDSMPTVSLFKMGELSAAQGQVPDFGGPIPPEVADMFTKQPETSIADARQKVKEAGLEQMLHLPDAPTIKTPALDIMIERARDKRERQATLARGPSGFTAGALSIGTSFLVSAVDPLNVASAFIPVIGEARYAKLMAEAGSSAVARAALRVGVGGASGAVGQAAIEPLEAMARTQEGQDYTMADALRSVMFGTVLGGGLHGGGGAIADVYRGRKGTPLYPFAKGEPFFDGEAGLFKVSPSNRPDVTPAPAAAGESRIADTFLNPPPAAAPADEGHPSLVEFLASRGGLRNDDAMIADVQSVIGRDNHLVPRHGMLIRDQRAVSDAAKRGGAGQPMTLDQAREAAVEAGYLVDHGKEAGGVGSTTVRSLLDAIDGEMRGQKVYPAGAKPKVTAAELEHLNEEQSFRQEQAQQDLDRALEEAGFKAGDVSATTRARAVDLMLKEGVHEPLDAYERASIETAPARVPGTHVSDKVLGADGVTGEQLHGRPADDGPSIADTLDDLPPRAKEDAMRASIAALHDGTPVRAAELLDAAAKTDPRVAESIEAWHGSPHDIERFNVEQVGEGQGAQSYGHGLYFAENPAVASSYQRSTPLNHFMRTVQELYDEFTTPSEAHEALAESKDFTPQQKRLLAALEKDDWLGFDYPHQAVAAAMREPGAFEMSAETREALAGLGHLYKVRINADRSKFLEWDRPLKEQGELLAKVRSLVAEDLRDVFDKNVEHGITAGNAYHNYIARNSADASAALRGAGIPGIKYLDQGSRRSGDGTHNFVVFDDSLIEITAKNGKAIPIEAARHPASLSAAARHLPELPQGAQQVGHGPNGPVVEGLQGRWNEAVTWLRTAETGDAIGVLEHPAVPGGKIDVIWGEPGAKGYGLAHIIDQGHAEVLADLPERLARMNLVRTDTRGPAGSERLVLQSGDRAETAIVRTAFDGDKKTWLLTAYTPESDHRGGGGRRGGGTPGSPADNGPTRSSGPPAEGNIARPGDSSQGALERAWQDLADRPREFDDYGSLDASHAAQSVPEPASVSPEPNKRIQAALAAEAEAKAEYDAAAAYLPDELKERVDRDLALLEAEVKDRNEIYNRGAACLSAVAAGVAG